MKVLSRIGKTTHFGNGLLDSEWLDVHVTGNCEGTIVAVWSRDENR